MSSDIMSCYRILSFFGVDNNFKLLSSISRFTGSAGQSFACFLTPGMNIRLVGEANDYVGKVLHISFTCLLTFSISVD